MSHACLLYCAYEGSVASRRRVLRAGGWGARVRRTDRLAAETRSVEGGWKLRFAAAAVVGRTFLLLPTVVAFESVETIG